MKKIKIKIKGRPGWHIECSVMSQKFLPAGTLDIHAGGRDLIFPHHENEIAQSEALASRLFTKYWMHGGLLTINGQKMAKSQGNFVTIRDFIELHKESDILKLFFLSAHYSKPIDYSETKIKETKEALERIIILIDKINAVQLPINITKKILEVEKIKDNFFKAMDDDFNTPQALAAVFELVTLTNKNIDNLEFVYHAKQAFIEFFDLLGLLFEMAKGKVVRKKITKESAHNLIDLSVDQSGYVYDNLLEEKEINNKILEREKARENKNYNLSDQIRKELEAQGIILEDTRDGKTTWRRKL